MATNRAPIDRIQAVIPADAAPVRHQPAHVHLIRQSHERCAALGLTRIERPDYEPLMRSDLTVARERNRRLYQHAAPAMEMLFEQIVNSQSMIVLTDAHGTILHSVGDDEFLERAGKVALTPGVNWAEHSKGTNAIGTALFEERPTLVHADEHFMHANSFLTCSAVPIFDPRGGMLGVLDVTGDHRSYHQHTMGLVRMSARMIENHWLCDDYSNRLRLHFHSRPEFIGTLLEGIIVVAADGKIIGGNVSALDQLAMSSAALRSNTLTSLFGITAAAVHDHFRSPLPVPMLVNLRDGPLFHLRAHLEWAMRPFAAGGTAEPTGDQRDGPAEPSATPQQRPPGTDIANLCGLDFMLTGDAQIHSLVDKARRIIDHDITLLIVGEAGTGKELLARAVHQDSNRAKQRFVGVNCAATSPALIEAELFGHGATTSPSVRRKGVAGALVQANGGTLFLDQIEELPLAVQTRLLRALQERCIRPSGGLNPIAIDVAVIASSRINLRELIERQQFLEDLYYRINGLVLRLPALRERSDFEALAQRILHTECPHGAPQIAPELLDLLRRYGWPGNVRQLAGALRTASVMAGGEPQITQAHLSDDLLEEIRGLSAPPRRDNPPPTHADTMPGASTSPVEPHSPITLEAAEIAVIRSALAAADGNISEASKRLGISRNTIYRKLRWNKPA
jgi:sigma-54 dependent transcriptional regulator, acetoin dehydrogenase operon transcriptional activator AcoR